MTRPLPDELDELERLLGKATQGRWENCTPETGDCGDPNCECMYIGGEGVFAYDRPDEEVRANTELAVAAVNILPRLIAACRERDALRFAAKQLLDVVEHGDGSDEYQAELQVHLEDLEEALTQHRDEAGGNN